MKSFNNGVIELQKVLGLAKQSWLLGAGASVESGIPLMYPLTQRVKSRLDGQNLNIFETIISELHENAHVEHVLSHLGDLLAIAERSRNSNARIADQEFDKAEIEGTHKAIVSCIAETIRYGYIPATAATPEKIGTADNPIVDVAMHLNFIREVFKGRSNLEPRSSVSFITTNYDTLLEDALAMDRRVASEGFSGGAIGYWDGQSIEPSKESYRTHRVLKLHGSVDWIRDPALGLLRARYGVKYLSDLSNILIYPQATKYLETQKDPFARIFDCFRRSIRTPNSQLLAIIGYSFGDDHINSEILGALEDPSNKLVVVAFSREITNESGSTLPSTLRDWLSNPSFGSRIYAATDKGIYNGNHRESPEPGNDLDWWKFGGVAKFLKSGVP